MSNLRFPDASVIRNSHFIMNITADKLADIQNRDILSYEKDYRNNLYCPECNKAKLFLRNGTEKIPHFSQSKNSFHDDDCSLNFDRISSKKLQIMYNDNPDEYEIHNRLKKIIGLFFRNNKTGSSPLVVSVSKKKKGSSSSSGIVEETHVKASIPRRLVTSLRDEDLNKIKIFYGEVYIQWVKTQNCSLWNLRMYKGYNEHSKKFFGLCCNLIVTDKVHNYVKKTPSYICNQHCYIAFFGEIEENKSKNNKAYYNCLLKRSEFLTVETLQVL